MLEILYGDTVVGGNRAKICNSQNQTFAAPKQICRYGLLLAILRFAASRRINLTRGDMDGAYLPFAEASYSVLQSSKPDITNDVRAPDDKFLDEKQDA